MADLHAIPEYKPTIHDLLLERKLVRILEAHLYADTVKRSRELWKQYTELHASRSPEYVRFLEREKGLNT